MGKQQFVGERKNLTEESQCHVPCQTSPARWKRQGRTKGDPPPERPAEPQATRYQCADATIEALAAVLAENPMGILLSRDELSGWVSSFDAYKGTRGADVAHWLSLHRAGSITVDRKTGARIIHVRRAAVSIAGTIQPETLRIALAGRYDDQQDDEASVKEHLANGLAARLLFAMPPVRAKTWTDRDMPQQHVDQVDRLFNALYALRDQPHEPDGAESPDEPVSVDLPLTEAARDEFVAFYNHHNAEQVTLVPPLQAAWAKLEGYAARFALLFQLVLNPEAKSIDRDAMERGIALSQWFGAEAVRIYRELGIAEDAPGGKQERDRKRLVAWIKGRGGTVTVRETQQGRRQYKTAEEAEAALADLAKAGYGSWQQSPPGTPGGPTRRFVLAAPLPPSTEIHNPQDPRENGHCVDAGELKTAAASPDNRIKL